MKSVCVLIVTYNRKEYLEKLIFSILKQSVRPKSLIIFDNHSTDGTQKMLIKKKYVVSESITSENVFEDIKIKYYYSKENTGGSGGFHYGFHLALQEGADYIWAMDDDVLPENDCLENLLNSVNEKIGVCIPCRTDDRYEDYAIIDVDMKSPLKYSIKKRKKVISSRKLTESTILVKDMPFEGPLFDTNIVKKVGLPNEKFFIIFDDTEYAYRIQKFCDLCYVKNAVLHKQIIPSNHYDNCIGWKEYYGFRNLFWFDREYGETYLARRLRPILNYFEMLCRSIVKRRMADMKVINRAWVDAKNSNMGKTILPGEKF